MKKILLNGVDGNFGSRAADVLLEKWLFEHMDEHLIGARTSTEG